MTALVVALLAFTAHSGPVAAAPFIAAADDAGSIYVIESNGDGTWSNYRLESSVGDTDRGLAVADFTGDGYADILGAVPSGSTTVFYLLANDGTNHFLNRGPIGSAASAGAAYGMSAGDFNHDGRLDVIASGDSSWIVVGLGRGDGTFSFTSTNTGIGNGRGVDVGDVNQDGHLDFVRARYSNGEISLFRGNGAGGFTNAGVVADPGGDPYGVALADFNNDGFLDIVAEAGSSGNAFFFAGNGTGTFAVGVAVSGPDVNNHACFGNLDANGDGNQDIVMGDYSGRSLYYVRGNGNGTFQEAVKISTSNTSSNVLGMAAPPSPAPVGYPLAVISPNPFFGGLGATVNFDASASTVGGSATSWTADWQFGDGGTAIGVTSVSHTYPATEGDYVVRLTITDSLGRVAIATGLVRLLGEPPVAVAGGLYTFGESFATAGVWTVPLNGSGSSDSSGSPLTYAWDPGNGLNETFGSPYRGNLPAPGLWAYSTQVTLAGGEATVVGAGAWTNRYLVTKAQYPRVPGQSFRGRLRVTAGGNRHIMWGLKHTNDDFNYTQFYYAIYFNNNTIAIYEGGSSRGSVGSFTDGTDYELRLDVKAFGADYYVRQVGAPAWTTLYSSLYSDSSPLRFGATVHSGTHRLDDFNPSVVASTLANPTVAYPRVGIYSASLTVTDTVGQTDTDTAQISLVPGAFPVANPGGPYTLGEASANCGQWTVAFSGIGSTDDSSIYLYEWDFGDGSTGTGSTPSHTYAGGGTYTVALTVTDQALQSHTATTTVTTLPGAPPVATAGGPYAVDEHAANAGLWTVNLTAAGSTDDRSICSYAWTFGDGGTGTGVAPTHAYAAVGTYTVTVTVTDHALQVHQASTRVTVSANDPPVPDPAGSYTFDESFALNGRWTGSFAGTGSADVLGIWTYAWDFGEVSAMAFDGSGPDAVVVPDTPDLRPAQLTVAAWVHPTTFPNFATVLMKSTNSSWANGYGLVHTNGTNDFRFFVNGYNASYVETTLPAGSWSFVAGTFDGTRVRLYVNGDPIGERSAGPISHSTGILEIGNGSGGDYPWNGQIDEVSLWNRALTPTEVRQLLSQSPTSPVDNLVAFWDFADGTGADRTGNGHDGTLAGNAVPGRATGTGITPSHAFLHAGTFPVTLTVTDHGRQARSATTQVTVLGNEPPVANAGPALVTEVGMPVTLDPSASSDDFGVWRTYWDFDVPNGWDMAGGALEAGEVILVGTGGWSDRYFVTGAATPRVAGDSYAGRIGVAPNSTSARNAVWGLKDTTTSYSYTAFTHAIYFTNGRLRVYEQGNDRGDKGAYLEDRFYEVRIVLKSSGATYYVRPEGVTAWTQIYDSTFSSASPLRLGITVRSGVAVCSDFRGPAGLLALPPSLRHTEAAVEVVYTTPGTYHPSVTVTDNAWQFDTAATVVTVLAGLPPVADNGGPYLTNEMLPTRLNARSSGDDFGIRWYDWDFGDGQSQRTRNPWLDHVYETAGTYLLTLTVTDYAGHSAVDTSTVNVIAAPVVACVPWQIQGGIEVPHDTLSGQQAILKAVCWSKASPVTYTWDFGDGSATESGTATDLYRIEARHTYTGIEGTPFIARLTVSDAGGQTATDTYPIRIRPPAIDVEINMAIDDGLWWLHGHMTRATFAAGTYAETAIGYGYWTNANGYGATNYKISPTASSLQGFHVSGHRETGDVRQDPYVETVGRGMRYITSALRPIGIGPQVYGDPDTNANTVGIETSLASDQRAPYEQGQAMDALIASGEASSYAISGPPLLMHRTCRNVVADMVDTYAWGQTDGSTAGGGWQYNWNSGVDNSAAQWGAIGLLAAEEVLGIHVPQWVKDRSSVWLTYSWDGTGFGYSGPGNGNCTTPSGMVQLAFVGANAIDDPDTAADDRDRRWASAENHIASQWNSSWWYPNSSLNNRFSYYAYYAFTKAMRVAKPHAVERLKSTGLDWFKDNINGIARRLINRQLTDGNWPKDNSGGSGGHVGDDLTTAWSVAMLSPTLFVQPPVADAGENRVWGLDVSVRLDGSRSYHLDPARAIVRYEWDLDEDGIYDTSSTTDPTVRVTYTPTGVLINGAPGGSAGTTYPPESLPRNLTVALRVTDNSDPPITDVDTVTITLAVPPHPPIAVAGGPYQARVGVPITLDGNGSFDIDPTDSITAWDWDTDGDQVYDDASGETVQVTFNSVGLYNLGLRVTDAAVMNDRNDNGVQDPEERLAAYDFTTVTVVTNSAPILNRSAQPRFTAITEDAAAPAGDTVQALLASDPAVPTPATDPDDDPIGIAVTGLSSTGPGTWQFRLEGAETWTDFGSLSLTAATLLPEQARVRFVPLLAHSNGQTGALAFQAWDHTYGTAGSTGIDVSVAGGDTAFSLASDSIDLVVADANDAPVLTTGVNLRLTTLTEDDTDPPGEAVQDVLNSDPGSLNASSDPDFGAASGIAVTGLTGTTTGTWQFRLAGAPAWTNLGAVSQSAATLLPAEAQVRFLPSSTFNNGQTVLLAFRAWDVTSGSPGADGVDTTINGGTTAFSMTTTEAVLLVTPVNDAPVLDPAGDLTLTLDRDSEAPGDVVAAILSRGPAGSPDPIADPDEGAVEGIAVIGLSGTDLGTWQSRRVADVSWQDFGAVSATSATLLAPDARVRFVPGPDFFGTTATLTFRAWDQTSGAGVDADVNTAVNGGTTAFSLATEAAVLVAPDLADLVVDEVDTSLIVTPCGVLDSTGTVSALVRNAGGTAMESAASVLFFEERTLNGQYDPTTDALLGTGTLPAGLAPAASATVSAAVSGTLLFAGNRVYVTVDAAGAVRERDETNNTGSSGAACAVLFDTPPGGDVKEVGRVPVPDLTASYVRHALVHLPLEVHLLARIGNAGAIAAPAPVPLAFYDGDPAAGGHLIGVGRTTTTLQPGTFEDIDITAPTTFVDRQTLFVRADDDGSGGGTLVECNEANNTCNVEVTIIPNHAPVLDPAAALVLPPITEDTADPAGNTVQAVLDSDSAGVPVPITDADGDPLGIAVVGLTQADRGTWQYALGSGPWFSLGLVSPTSALLLDVDARLRFVPDLAYNNGHSALLTYRAWDRTAGTPGQSGVNASVGGGYAAFSTALDSVSLRVQDANDAPVLDDAALLTAPETTAGTADPPGFSVQSVLTGGAPAGGAADPDTGALTGMAVSDFGTLSGGRWQFRLAGESLWREAPTVSAAAALLLPPDAELRFRPPPGLIDDRMLTVSFRAWDGTSGVPGATAATTPNGGTTAFSAAAYTFALLVRADGEVTDNWWYPAFSWEPIPASGAAAPYGWYHVQVFAKADLTEPYFEANVHGTTMTVAEYFLAAFDGFPGGRWLWRYRPWDPATDTYGSFTPDSLTEEPDSAYVLDLDYGPAAVPASLAVTNPAPGIHLLSFLVGNARAYEVRAVRASDGEVRTWRHAFIPGEDPAKQQGTPATLGLDNPPMEPPEIPRDELATLAVNLPEPGIYRLYVRGFNPTDERDDLPPFAEFPQPLTIAASQPAYAPPTPTGLFPRDGDILARTESVSRVHCRLRWDSIVGADRFLLYLAAVDGTPLFDSSDGADLNLPAGSYFDFANVGPATGFEVSLLPGLYIWQVVGISDRGAVPDYGTWSQPRYFDVIPSPAVPAMATSIELLSPTRVRVYWSSGDALPDLVEGWLWGGSRRGWLHYPPRALLDVNRTEGTGDVEIPDLSLGRQRYLRLRGHALSRAGELTAGKAVTFPLFSRRGNAGPLVRPN